MAGHVIRHIVSPTVAGRVSFDDPLRTVDVVNQHAVSFERSVPSRLLTVFEQEKFTFGIGRNQVGLVLLNGIEFVVARTGERRRGQPSRHHALHRRERRRRAASVVPTALTHERPVEDADSRTEIATVRIVEIGPAEHMTELVAEGSDAGHAAVEIGRAAQLRRTGVDAQLLAAEHLARIGYFTPVRPYGIHTAAVGFVVTGIVDEDVVDFTVIVEIVLRKVDAGTLRLVAGLDNHSFGILVAIISIGTVISDGMVERHRTHHVEGRAEQSSRVIEVVVTRTAERSVVRIPLLIEHPFESTLRIGHRETDVTERRQNHHRTDFARRRESRFQSGARLAAQPMRASAQRRRHHARAQRLQQPAFVGCAAAALRHADIAAHGTAVTLDQIIVETIGTLIDGITIGGDSIVEKLVAANSQRQRRAVRLPHTGKPAGIRRP